jgi:hypothetical protein
MSVLSTEVSTYDQVGKREDVSDIITNISPTKTPFQTMIGSEGIHNIVHQWQEDSLLSVGSNAQVEGAAAPSVSWQPTLLRSNNTQILSKTASVSGSADAVKTYGRDKELAYQLSLRSAEIKRDLENALVGANTTAVLGNDTTARVMASAFAQINNAVTFTMGVGGGLNFSGSTPATAVVTETALLQTLQQLYINGAEPDTIMIRPAMA